jgi:ankyrin repeat protein
LELLLEYGADLNAMDQNGLTLLTLATGYNPQLAMTLLKKFVKSIRTVRPEKHESNVVYQPIFHFAIMNNASQEIIQYLLSEAKVDLTEQNSDGTVDSIRLFTVTR